jgi:hypothetical protein
VIPTQSLCDNRLMTLTRDEELRRQAARWHNLGQAVEEVKAKERAERQQALRQKVFTASPENGK